ncbi:MAG: nodulation protein NfeD [Sphingobacteriia bacterium]|nr:nodulation protein NfeD [Sphingobacteriia bacterium]
MNQRLHSGFVLILLLLIADGFLFAQHPENPFNDKSKVYRIYTFDIRENIAPPVWHVTKKALQTARDTAADLVIIQMNTYGGMLESADSIRTAILHSTVPVWVFIDNNAASAGALISIACDSIYMRPGGSIGAATVVDQAGEVVPDKYQSYMRSMMRSTAEAKGRDPKIAEGMVDPRIKIPGVSDSGQVITFTTSEAIKFGFAEGEAENLQDVLEVAGINDYKIIRHELKFTDRIIRFLINPVVSGILIMIIIGGLYFELQTPGIGFPIAASIVAAMLYFMPLYIEGIATHWEIIMFIAGVILIAVELFVLPGFGVAGISGIVLVVAGLAFGMVDIQNFETDSFPFRELLTSLFIVIIAAFVSLTLSFWISKKLFTTTTFGELALRKTQERDQGYTSASDDYMKMIGKEGIAKTVLRPAGKILIDDETYDATAESGFIEKGEPVKVVKYINAQLFVRKRI